MFYLGILILILLLTCEASPLVLPMCLSLTNICMILQWFMNIQIERAYFQRQAQLRNKQLPSKAVTEATLTKLAIRSRLLKQESLAIANATKVLCFLFVCVFVCIVVYGCVV